MIRMAVLDALPGRWSEGLFAPAIAPPRWLISQFATSGPFVFTPTP